MNKTPVAPIHVHPTAPLADRVLLPGDPGRALLLAQELLNEPKMFNHNRGLWGYTGAAADGAPLTIQSTGMGGPSAAIVVEELIALGARRLVRIGTCGALDGSLALGDLLIAERALCEDGASARLTGAPSIEPDPDLLAALSRSAGGVARGAVASTDLFYDPDPEHGRRWLEAGARAVEMEAATVLAVARRHGAAGACVLAVSDIVLPERVRIDPDTLQAAALRMGRAAVAALAP